jgi:hypothetical protein
MNYRKVNISLKPVNGHISYHHMMTHEELTALVFSSNVLNSYDLL